jgi:adenosylcobinamide-GDP ribazoletransferase
MKEDRYFPGDVGAIFEELKTALAFLTRLPAAWLGVDGQVRPDFTTAARVFPLAGAIIGAIGGLVLLLLSLVGVPSLVAGPAAVAATMILTGALPEDGLADTADGFGVASREKKLEVMEDSRVGTYGAGALIFSVLLRSAALAAIAAHSPLAAALALVAGEAVSRAAVVRMWHDLPTASARSMASDLGPPDYNAMLVALVLAAVIVLLTAFPALGWRPTLLAGVLAIAAAYAVIRVVADALGGRTADTLGACQQVTLAAFLIGASAL